MPGLGPRPEEPAAWGSIYLIKGTWDQEGHLGAEVCLYTLANAVGDLQGNQAPFAIEWALLLAPALEKLKEETHWKPVLPPANCALIEW